MTNLHEGMSPDERIELEPVTIRISGRRASDIATAPCSNLVLHFVLCSVYSDCCDSVYPKEEIKMIKKRSLVLVIIVI